MCQVTDELLEKTIGEMSGIEFIQLIKAANEDIIVVDKKMAMELAKQPVYHRRGA